MGWIEDFERSQAEKRRGHYAVGSLEVRCPHCAGEEFERGHALLNTAGLTLLGLDWANREATVLICTACGYVNWFLEIPESV